MTELFLDTSFLEPAEVLCRQHNLDLAGYCNWREVVLSRSSSSTATSMSSPRTPPLTSKLVNRIKLNPGSDLR